MSSSDGLPVHGGNSLLIDIFYTFALALFSTSFHSGEKQRSKKMENQEYKCLLFGEIFQNHEKASSAGIDKFLFVSVRIKILVKLLISCSLYQNSRKHYCEIFSWIKTKLPENNQFQFLQISSRSQQSRFCFTLSHSLNMKHQRIFRFCIFRKEKKGAFFCGLPSDTESRWNSC